MCWKKACEVWGVREMEVGNLLSSGKIKKSHPEARPQVMEGLHSQSTGKSGCGLRTKDVSLNLSFCKTTDFFKLRVTLCKGKERGSE